ncbi:winged helix-turn-helix transcriptional regulator [Oceanivirga miroungae]|uniref:HxlR family transcriptional regulator n=1 Tax=Oceanivirga miroungae TaxID=1130046 RepID=A0A6I8M6T1_9FUSO|nr:helix-turn-helix domain-containing protein [Oceanivirga miroungae]VWL85095.1 HxlR family transcriptional regulator [Oceanivirga miroungae]
MYKLNGREYGCPVEAVSNFLGKKWVAQIICVIGNRQKHFSELKRSLEGCSTKMLSQQLKMLQELGIVENNKEILENNEVRSLYYLTEKGKTILPILEKIISWGDKNLEA